MRKAPIVSAAIVGFLVPVLCGFIQMLLFNGQDAGWTHFLCYQLPYILCPVWHLGDGSAFWFVAMPFLNAVIYGVAAFVWVTFREASKLNP